MKPETIAITLRIVWSTVKFAMDILKDGDFHCWSLTFQAGKEYAYHDRDAVNV